jgi:hypothetical protein
MIVFWGLWTEKKAHKEAYLNVNDLRASKRREERGWNILMFGIAIEILVAFVFAAKDGWEIRQINKEIVKIDPLNQPISDISASVTIMMRTKETGLPPSGPQPENWMELLEKDMGDKAPRAVFWGGFQRLLEDNAQGFTSSDSSGSQVGYSIQFRADRLFASSPQNGFVLADQSPTTPKHILSKIETLAFHVVYIPKDAEIVGGSAEVLVNGTFRKEFKIFSQKPATNVSAPGVFYATNAIH